MYLEFGRRYEIRTYRLLNGVSPVKKWLASLSNREGRRIRERLARIEEGYFGDFRNIGKEVYELRFFFGSGYRIYFTVIGSTVILLLQAGDKSTQSRDIKLAKRFLEDYKERNKNGQGI